MSKTDQSGKNYGSQYWLQRLVNDHEPLLNEAIAQKLGKAAGSRKPEAISWVSPLKDDKYEEYMDAKFLVNLGLQKVIDPLKEFWPKSGPRWDGLATWGDRGCILVEAKSHIDEINSPPCGAKEPSRTKIEEAFKSVQKTLNIKGRHLDWMEWFYQYNNRMAHLTFLREQKVHAFLVNVCFINDCRDGVFAPDCEKAWESALYLMKTMLGLKHTKYSKYCADVFIDVKKLKS
jgi:hypothetical protein